MEMPYLPSLYRQANQSLEKFSTEGHRGWQPLFFVGEELDRKYPSIYAKAEELGIYIIDKETKVTFRGYASLHGRCADQLTKSFSGRRVEYWKLRLEEIFKQ